MKYPAAGLLGLRPVVAALVCLASVNCAGLRSLPEPAGPAIAHARCQGVRVAPSDSGSVQRVLRAHPTGTTFCFGAGVYRFTQPIDPKAGQRLISEIPHAAVLDGAVVLTDFSQSGNAYFAKAQLQASPASSLNCVDAGSLCDTRQDVFFDGKPLIRATSRSGVRAGTFFEDFAANRIWIGRNPAGHLLEQAFASALVWSQSGGIVIDGFVVEFAANQAQHGAIQSYGYSGAGWTIENNVIRYNHAAGVASVPSEGNTNGTLIEHNLIAGNGQEGIAAVGDALTIRDNEITANNRVNYSCWWECGGAKFAGGPGYESRELVVENNYVHDNNGPGFWNDINSYDMTYRHNRILRNVQLHGPYGYSVGSGIFIEISDRALVEDNTVEDNGPPASKIRTATFYLGAQIEVSASANVTVRGNHASGAAGIGMLQQARSDSCIFGSSHGHTYPDGTAVCPHRYGGKLIHWVHDNTFTGNDISETAPSGLGEVAGLDCDLHHDASAFSATNANFYRANSYALLQPKGAYFSWLNTLMDASAWQSRGQDAGSTF